MRSPLMRPILSDRDRLRDAMIRLQSRRHCRRFLSVWLRMPSLAVRGVRQAQGEIPQMAVLRSWTACALVLLAASSAEAGNSFNRDPSFTIEGTQLVLNLRAGISSKPACNTSNRFVADLQSDAGKSFLEILNAAKQSRLVVRADGTNTCTILSNAEDLNSLKLYGAPWP